MCPHAEDSVHVLVGHLHVCLEGLRHAGTPALPRTHKSHTKLLLRVDARKEAATEKEAEAEEAATEVLLTSL